MWNKIAALSKWQRHEASGYENIWLKWIQWVLLYISLPKKKKSDYEELPKEICGLTFHSAVGNEGHLSWNLVSSKEIFIWQLESYIVQGLNMMTQLLFFYSKQGYQFYKVVLPFA